MKRLFLLLALCGMVAVGCTEQPGGENEIPDDAYITLNKEVLTFVPDGESVEVKVCSNYEWTLTNNCDWVTASISGGEASEEGTTITLTANLTYDNREGTIIFNCGKAQKVLVVSQGLKEVIIADENNTFNLPVEGGTVDIAYQTTVECEVIIPEEAKSWISLADDTRGLVSESAALTVAENTTYSERSAVVKVVKVGDNTLFAEYTINQVKNDAIIADENNVFKVPAEGGNVIINYQTTVECEVIIPEEAKSWISLADDTRGLVSESATLTVAENTTYSERSAVVKVVKVGDNTLFAEYTINQVKNDAIIADENNTFNLNGCAQSINIAYQTNVEYEVIIPEEAKSWISLAPATRALVNESATLNIADNNTGAERSAVVKVVAANNKELVAEYTITQNQRYFMEYTSEGGYTVRPYDSSAFDATIIRNEYIDGKGYIDFDAPITSIGYRAFYYCTSLTSVTIPDSVTSIGSYAFIGCSSLTSVTIPDSVTSIGYRAFYYCTSLTSITIPDSVTSIGDVAFLNCDSLTSVTIGNGVTKIGDSAFSSCDSLTSITIPDSVTSIGSYAFYHCTSLTSVTIPDSVTSIGDDAFYECTSLTSVTIGNGVTSIGDNAFYGCTSLTSVYITDIAAWCNISFSGGVSNPLCYAGNLYLNNELVTDLIIPDGVTSIGDDAFYKCTSLTSVTIPDSVTSIGKYAFSGCNSLTSVTIPDSVTSIGSYAFDGCTGELIVNCNIPSASSTVFDGAFYGSKFTQVTIGDSVTSIGSCAFYECHSLTSVTIGKGVTSIGSSAFYHCTSLTSVTIPDSVTSIGGSAFRGCYSLKEVYCKPTTPPTGGSFMFNNNASGCNIYVPRNSVSAYKSASGWSDYASDIVGYDF